MEVLGKGSLQATFLRCVRGKVSSLEEFQGFRLTLVIASTIPTHFSFLMLSGTSNYMP
jgi:hypothetical protein